MITLEDIYSGIQSIQSSLDEVIKKSHSLNQSSILGIDDDLIERLNAEIQRLQIEDELIPGTFDEEIALNKATYYFEKQSTITNKRAYLTKILLQIPRHQFQSSGLVSPGAGNEVDGSKGNTDKPEMTDAEIDEYLYKFNALSDSDIAKIVFEHEKIMWLVHGLTRDTYKAFHRVILAKKGLEMGLIE